MPGPPSMLVVIVNYRCAALTIACLDSLEAEVRSVAGLRIAVVDNASDDGSVEAIGAAIAARRWDWATLLPSPVNGGFAAGNNLAVRRALSGPAPPDLFWLLNPDTRVQPGAASALIDFMRRHPAAGIAGTALHEADGRLWPYAFRFPSILGEIERGARLGLLSRALSSHATARRMGDRAAQVDWVSGASCAVRREVFETAGLMDQDYFLYYEETDFCRQARLAGWECWYVPDAAVLHIAGQSTGVTGAQATPSRVPRYWFESRRRYFEKNHGRAYAIVADLGWAVAHLVWRLRRRASRSVDTDPPSLLGDFLRSSALAWRRPAPLASPAERA